MTAVLNDYIGAMVQVACALLITGMRRLPRWLCSSGRMEGAMTVPRLHAAAHVP